MEDREVTMWLVMLHSCSCNQPLGVRTGLFPDCRDIVAIGILLPATKNNTCSVAAKLLYR